MNKALTVAKINFRNMKLAVILTAITCACGIVQDIVMTILEVSGVSTYHAEGLMSISNFLLLLIPLSAVFIPSLNYRKMMNLGGKRGSFFTGCFVNHTLIAAGVSLAGVVLYYTYERLILSLHGGGWTLSVLYWFGWLDSGPAVAFLQQFAFLLLAASLIHTLVTAQDKWYGWAADLAIVAVIAVFTPIAPLRAALVWFFNLIIFSAPLLQISSCLVLAVAVYALNKPMLARKAI